MPRDAPPASFHPLSDAGARSAYAEVLAASPQRTPFSDLPFADAACAAFGYAGGLLLTDGGGLVVYEKAAGPYRAAALPPYGEFVTPVLAGPLSAADVHRRSSPLDALAAALAERVHQASLRPHPALADVRPLAWAGWTLTPAYHMEAPLGGETGTDAWGRYTRKAVRRHADDYEVQAGREHVGAVVDLAAESLAAKGLGHAPTAPCRQLAAALVEAGQAQAFVAVSAEDTVEAGAVIVFGGPTAHYWMVGSRPGPAMTVLLAHVAAEAVQAGCTTLHLGGANVPSVAEFKRGLGGALVPVVRARFVRGVLPRLRDAWARR